MKEHRVQLDLRRMIDEYLGWGWEIVSRDPLTLARKGTKQRKELRHGVVVSV